MSLEVDSDIWSAASAALKTIPIASVRVSIIQKTSTIIHEQLKFEFYISFTDFIIEIKR